MKYLEQNDAELAPTMTLKHQHTDAEQPRHHGVALKSALAGIALACSLAWVPASFADMPREGDVRDAWLDGKLESALLFNEHLNSFTIDTDVKGSTAYLSGHVESDIDRDLAEEIAKSVEGVTAVENKLVVSKEAGGSRDLDNDGHPDRSFKRHVMDATVTAKIKSKLLLNENTQGLSINVDTRNGNVTLTGPVDSATERDLAAQIAGNVDGVAHVDNNLRVAAK